MNELNKAKRMLWLFGIFKIPLIGYVKPQLLELSDKRMVIKISLRRRTKNHLGSMYFGALAIGADLAGAYQAFHLSAKTHRKTAIVFKDFKANFLKRPEGDVFFVSEAGEQIQAMLAKTFETKERITENIQISAIINYPENPETVAEFMLGLSVKDKTKE